MDQIRQSRLDFDIDRAWEKLKEVLEEHNLSSEMKAEYYLTAAKWSIEDFADNTKADTYLQKALDNNPSIDQSGFKALKMLKEKKYDAAIKELGEIDCDKKLNYLLYILVNAGRGIEAEEYIKKTIFTLSPNTRHLLAMCYIQANKLQQALREMKILMSEFPYQPVYLLTMGQVWYWKAIPLDLRQTLTVAPVVFPSSLFSPNDETVKYLKKALSYFEDATNFLKTVENNELKYHLEENWILTAQLIDNIKNQANCRMLELLSKAPSRIIPLTYIVENNLILDEHKHLEPLHKLVQMSDKFIDHAALLIQATNDLELLEVLEVEFARKGKRNLWLRLKIAQLLNKKELVLAQELLDCGELGQEEKENMELLHLEVEGKSEELLYRFKCNTEEKQDRFSYARWAFLCYKYKDFSQLKEAAEGWLKRFPDAIAVELLASAYSSEGMYNESIILFQDHLDLFPDRKLTVKCRYMQYWALWMCGKVELAIEISNGLWDEGIRDSNLLIHRAQLYIQYGDVLKSRTTLIDGFDKGIKSFQSYLLLSQLLVLVDPNEAFRYAKEAMQEYPDISQAYINALTIAYRTGHELEAGTIMHQIQVNFGNDSPLISFNIKEFPKMNKKWSEDSKKRWQYVEDAVIPRHIVLGLENNQLASDFYWRWANNSIQTPSRLPVHVCYGGIGQLYSTDSKDISLYMDYSACLISNELGLFTKIFNSFQRVFVSPRLLSVIQYEIDRIADIQPTRIESERKILSLIESSTIEIVELNYSKIMNDPTLSELHHNDFSALFLAREYKGKIISENFAYEMFGSDVVPELEMYRIFPAEIIQVLVEKGEIFEESATEYLHNKRIRANVVAELHKNNPILIVDHVFLEELIRKEWFNNVVDAFKLVISKTDIDLIKQNIGITEKRSEVRKKLERLFSDISNFKRKKMIEYSSFLQHKDAEEPLSQIIYDMIKFGESSTNTFIWCDDRTVSNYGIIGETPILSTYAVIEWLLQQKKININEYMEKIKKLLEKNFQFYIPSVEYLYTALEKAEVLNSYEILNENNWLKVLRRNIADSLGNNSTIITRMVQNNGKPPEFFVYLRHLDNRVEETLKKIWESDKGQNWKRAASDWLLIHILNSFCEVSHLAKIDVANIRFIVIKHIQLICVGLFMNSFERKDFFDWLLIKLQIMWTEFPEVKNSVIEEIVDLCANIFSDSVFKETKKDAKFLLGNFIMQLPTEFVERCIRDIRINNILKIDKNMHVLESDCITISKTDWIKFIDRAVQRGAGEEGLEEVKNQKIKVIFSDGDIWSHAIIVESITLDGKRDRIMYYEPMSLLYSSNLETRKQWFKLAEPYLKDIDNITKYKDEICSEKNSNQKIEHLMTVLEDTFEIFFARIRFFLARGGIPENDILFPHSPNVFSSCIADIPDICDDGTIWISISRKLFSKLGSMQALDILSCLPLGNQWDFTVVVNNLIEENYCELEDTLSWAQKEIINSENPVKQQNICRFLLERKADLLDLDLVNNVLMSQIEVNCNVNHKRYLWYKLYLTILQLAWAEMEDIAKYKNINDSKKILWCYIYAEMMVKSISELVKNNKGKLSYSIKTICVTFAELLNQLVKNKNPFGNHIDANDDVAHPNKSSFYRTVLGGSLTILSRQKLDEDYLGKLKPLLVEISQSQYSPKNDNGFIEQFKIFDGVPNGFNSYFNQNVKEKLHTLLREWGSNVDEFDATQFALGELQKALEPDYDINLVLGHLAILATQPLPHSIIDLVAKLIEKFKIASCLTDDQLIFQGKVFASIIRQFPEAQKNIYTDCYIKILKEIMSQQPERWTIILEILLRLCFSKDIVKIATLFIASLKIVLSEVTISRIPRDFFDTLWQLCYYIPYEVVGDFASLRREISRYY